MLRFLTFFVNVKKLPQNAKLYRFEKIPKEINDVHISMYILVNINELYYHRDLIKQKLNDSLKWQCIFDTNPPPLVIPNHVKLPTHKTRLYAKL